MSKKDKNKEEKEIEIQDEELKDQAEEVIQNINERLNKMGVMRLMWSVCSPPRHAAIRRGRCSR